MTVTKPNIYKENGMWRVVYYMNNVEWYRDFADWRDAVRYATS